MNDLNQKIESILFVATKPLTAKHLAELTGVPVAEVETAIEELATKLNTAASGVHLMRHGQSVQFVTSPAASKLVTEYLKEEQAGELTRPALETLTIIAYRGPVSKIQLDTIRGVNCSLILRNLMIKGLVEAKAHKDKLQNSYEVTTDFLRFLGLSHISELPDYERLHQEETLNMILNPQPAAVAEDETPAAQSADSMTAT
jgi:segregation and condensation protein B